MLSKALVIVLWISCCLVKVAHSQSDELIVQGQTGKLYLQHTVVAKENWYSVGRLYNESPKVIATYNNLVMTKPLTIGQQLNIPLDATNFSQTGAKAATETLVPVYHVVQDKEWMYRVSVNHNKVPIPMLEKWNNVNKDQVKAGMHLIIGYLKVNTAQSALAKNGGRAPVAAAPAVSEPAVAKNVPASTGVPAGVEPAEKTTTATEKVTAAKNPAFDRAAQDKALAEKAATERVAADKAAADRAAAEKAASDKSAADKAARDKAAAATAAATTATATPAAATAHPVAPTGPAINFNGGYFKVDFVDGGKFFSGVGGVFKSTSGWQDGKYYALMNNVNVGTIVKITVAGSNKSIYAKVLGQLPDMKESVGLSVRVSSAAASELGQGDGRFNIDVKY